MKNIFAMMLILTLILGLCACGSNPVIGENEGDAELTGSGEEVFHEPSDEERDLLWTYMDMAIKLEEYAAKEVGDRHISYRDKKAEESYIDNEALKYMYQQLQSMENLDMWLNDPAYMDENFGHGAVVNWDRQSLLDRFVVLQDVKISQVKTRVDNLDNVRNLEAPTWSYDANGNVILITDNYKMDGQKVWEGWSHDCHMEYDENGRFSGAWFGEVDSKYGIITPVYDDDGRLVSEILKTKDYDADILYTYDDFGRIATVQYYLLPDGLLYPFYELSYTYDEDGKVTQKVLEEYYQQMKKVDHDYTTVTVYSYDANGHLVSSEETRVYHRFDSQQVNTRSYLCDEQGRVVKETLTPGSWVFSDGSEDAPDYVSCVTETFYGDYYFFIPAA